jgi:hypothetical protein
MISVGYNNSAKDINDNNNYKESEIKIQNGQTNYQLETSNYEFTDPVCLFDLQVSPQFISEEDTLLLLLESLPSSIFSGWIR